MNWLYTTPLVAIAPLVILLLLGALEVGFRLGRIAPVTERQISTIAGPILAVVGLLLAFSFGMAEDRHAARRAAAVQEVNSIGTFWLRTSLLPEPIGSEMRSRVRRYVDLHIEHRQAGVDQASGARLEAEAMRLQQELWTLLLQEVRRNPEALSVRLVTPALNAMIDDTTSVLAAKENRLPDAILAYLSTLVLLSGVVIGYRPGGEERNKVLWAVFTVVLGGVLIILLDIDRPRQGLIQTDVALYSRLREGLHE